MPSESVKKKTISYTGIILDRRSKDRLQEFIKEMRKAKKINITDGWTFSADHVTINVGPAMNPELIGLVVSMKVLSFSYDNNVIAVSVNVNADIDFQKEQPHITIAFNAAEGARPVMSNKLTNWKPVPKSFILTGTIQEVLLNQ